MKQQAKRLKGYNDSKDIIIDVDITGWHKDNVNNLKRTIEGLAAKAKKSSKVKWVETIGEN